MYKQTTENDGDVAQIAPALTFDVGDAGRMLKTSLFYRAQWPICGNVTVHVLHYHPVKIKCRYCIGLVETISGEGG